MDDPRSSLTDAVKGDRRQQLEAYRDYIAAQLESKTCKSCDSSQLRYGEQTSLIKLLKDITAEIDAMNSAASKTSRLSGIRGGVANLDAARERRQATGDRRHTG
jgi:hypothetical protein